MKVGVVSVFEKYIHFLKEYQATINNDDELKNDQKFMLCSSIMPSILQLQALVEEDNNQ